MGKPKEKSSKLALKRLLLIANEYLNPEDASSLDSLEKRLKAWFAFKYETTLNDDRLLDMSLEELILHYQLHRLKDDPAVITEAGATYTPEEEADYEEWLKKEMGDNYVSDADMVKGMEKEEQEFQQKVRARYPDKITTDFDQFKKD